MVDRVVQTNTCAGSIGSNANGEKPPRRQPPVRNARTKTPDDRQHHRRHRLQRGDARPSKASEMLSTSISNPGAFVPARPVQLLRRPPADAAHHHRAKEHRSNSTIAQSGRTRGDHRPRPSVNGPHLTVIRTAISRPSVNRPTKAARRSARARHRRDRRIGVHPSGMNDAVIDAPRNERRDIGHDHAGQERAELLRPLRARPPSRTWMRLLLSWSIPFVGASRWFRFCAVRRRWSVGRHGRRSG